MMTYSERAYLGEPAAHCAARDDASRDLWRRRDIMRHERRRRP